MKNNFYFQNAGKHFAEVLEEIDAAMADPDAENSKELKLCQIIKDEFQAATFQEAFSSLKGLNREVCLMILQQALPGQAEALVKISNLPLDKFESIDITKSYLDAIITSGIASDTDRGIVFLVGNTGVGKSSLANTLKAYIEEPSKNPRAILAGEGQHKDLLETQVLEVYKDMPFQQDQDYSVNLTPTGKGPILVDFIEEKSGGAAAVESKTSVRIKLVDMGGHQEYYACSSLFFSTSGLFLICFNSLLLKVLEEPGKILQQRWHLCGLDLADVGKV